MPGIRPRALRSPSACDSFAPRSLDAVRFGMPTGGHGPERALKTLGVLLAGATLCLATPRVWSQSSTEVAARRLLLDQADHARGANDHHGALDFARRAGAIMMSPSLRHFIATEEEAVGQLAAALGDADLCVREAERDTTARDRANIQADCRELLASLRRRIGQVTVRLPDPRPQGLQVRVAGDVVDPALYGVNVPVNPGHIAIDATTGDGRTYHSEMDVAPGVTHNVEVTFPPPPPPSAQSSASPPPSAAPAAVSAAPAPEVRETTTFMTTARIAGIGIGVAGVVLAIVGSVLYPAVLQPAFDTCQMNACQTSAEPVVTNYVAAGFVIGGAIFAVGGVLMAILAPSEHHREQLPPPRAFLWIDPAGHAVGLEGRF